MMGGDRQTIPIGTPALVLALTLVLTPAEPAAAIETEARVEVEVMVPPLQRLEVDPLVLVTPEIQAEDLTVGFAELPRPIVLTVSSNTPWELFVRAAGDGKAAGDFETKGTSPLEWAVGSMSYRALGPEWTAVASGGGPVAAETVELHLRLRLIPGELEPGVYEPRLEYRLVTAGE
jgi:hypothetical protein